MDVLLGNPSEPGNLGSTCSSAAGLVGIPGAQVPSPSRTGCGRVCPSRRSVAASSWLLQRPWQAAACPLPLAKHCASQQSPHYLIFQICVNNPPTFSIQSFSQMLCAPCGSWLSPGMTHFHFRPEKKLACWKLVWFFSPTVLVGLIKYITLCPQTLLLYVLRPLHPTATSTTIAKLGNSVVCTVTESSGTSACWGYGFSEAVLRKTADLEPKVALPFPPSGFGKGRTLLRSCCILVPGLLAPTWTEMFVCFLLPGFPHLQGWRTGACSWFAGAFASFRWKIIRQQPASCSVIQSFYT